MIPRRIIQTVKDKNHYEIFLEKGYPQTFEYFMPKYEKFICTNDEQEAFVKNYPEWYEIFKELPLPVNRSDFFRLCALYHLGGFYFDIDIECIKNIENLRSNDLIFPVEEVITKSIFEHEKQSGRYRNLQYSPEALFVRYAQYGMASIKNHWFIKEMAFDIKKDLQYIKHNVDSENHEYFIYNATATDKANYSIYTHKPEFLSLFKSNHPIRTTEKLTYPLFYGDYGIHYCRGIWKKNGSR